MGKDRLENFVKDKLGDYQSPVDTDAIWAGLQGSIESTGTASAVSSNNQSYWKWFAGALLLISFAGIGFYIGRESVDNSLINDSINELSNSKTSTEVVATQQINQLEAVNSSTPVENTSSESIQTNNTTQALQLIENANNYNTEKSIASNSTSAVPSETKSYTDESKTGVNTSFINDNTSIDSENAEKINVQTDTNNSAVMAEGLRQQNKERSEINNQWLYTDIDLLDIDNQIATKNLKLPKNVECPTFGGSRSGQFSAELQLIPLYSSPRFIALDEVGENWVSRKMETESYLEAFQINLLGRYQFRNGIYLHAGIGYGQIDEKFKFNSQDISTTIENDVPVIIIQRPNGMNDTITGNVEVLETNTLEAETYNYHRMIELPFALGYEIGLNESLGLYADFGGSVNLSTFRKGYLVVDDIDVISFDDATRPVYKISTGFKVNGGAGLRYYPGNGISFSVGPEVRYHTSNWIRDEHPFEQRYLDVGLRLATSILF